MLKWLSFTSLFSLLCESAMDDELRLMEQCGYKILDKREFGGYCLFLTKDPFGNHQMGLSFGGNSMITPDAQKKTPAQGNIIRHLKEIEKILDEWEAKWAPLYIGSLNKERTETYHKIFSRHYHTSHIKIIPPSAMTNYETGYNFLILGKLN